MKGTSDHFFGSETEGYDAGICDDLPEEAGEMELNQCLIDDVIDYCDSVDVDEDTTAVVCVSAHNLFQEFPRNDPNWEEWKKKYGVRGSIQVYENGELSGEGEFSPTSDGTVDSEQMRDRFPSIVSSIDTEDGVKETDIHPR